MKGYDGIYCENDEDGCVFRLCWFGVDCIDVFVRDFMMIFVGFICGLCLFYFDGDGIICLGIYI